MYKNTFVEVRKILKGESLLITKKIDKIPSYNLSIKLNISNTPFTFNNQEPVIGHLKEKTTILIWNVITVITLIGLLLLIGIIILLVKDIKRKTIEETTVAHNVTSAQKKIITKKK